jgi:hypothetical protein
LIDIYCRELSDCLLYAISNGYIYDEIELIKLASRKDFRILKYFHENFPEKLTISKYIIMNNYTWKCSLSELIISYIDFEALEIYKKHGCPHIHHHLKIKGQNKN